MKAAELRKLSVEELGQRLEEEQRGLFNLRLRSRVEELPGTAEIIKLRREIARIKSVLRERELLAQAERQPEPAQE